LDTLGEHPVARASRSWLLFFDGRCQDAARTVDGVLAEADVDPKAVIWACAAGSAARGFLGEGCAAEKVHAHGARIAAAHADVLPWGEVEVDTGMCLAHLASGHPNAAYDIAVAGYHKALDGGATMMVAGWALHAGLAALARGHLDEAARLLAEAQAGFDVNDTFRLGRCCLAARAGAAALAGDRAAYQLMARADKLAHPCNKVLAPWIDGWRAWTAYAAGDLGSAVVAAKRAADAAREAAMPAVETLARYDLARLGAPVDLVRLSGIDHEIAGTACRAARALANRDCTADLETAARAFHANGYDLLAAELYGAAGHRYHRLHRWAESDLAKAHAVKLRAAFPNARSPLLRPDDLTTLLTFRERQVLMLAVEHTSAEIAGRLRLAVATVNNNLARAYHKLGINGRSQLRDLLDGERNG
jgi:DNA-binding CsgD family transcriptional regulator/predicted nucleotidyltransferase